MKSKCRTCNHCAKIISPMVQWDGDAPETPPTALFGHSNIPYCFVNPKVPFPLPYNTETGDPTIVYCDAHFEAGTARTEIKSKPEDTVVERLMKKTPDGHTAHIHKNLIKLMVHLGATPTIERE